MAMINLQLTPDEAEFVLQVLQHQPLPFVRTAPLINKIGQAVVESRRPQDAQVQEA